MRELTDYFVPLIDVICARKEYATAYHLSHDAAHRPDVYVLLVAHTQNHLTKTDVHSFRINTDNRMYMNDGVKNHATRRDSLTSGAR